MKTNGNIDGGMELIKNTDYDVYFKTDHTLDDLPRETREYLRAVFAGELLPTFYSDIIAKRLLNPDLHPERLNFLLREIVKDDTIY